MDPETPVWSGHTSHWHYFGWWVLGVILAPVIIGFLIILWIIVRRERRTYRVTPTKVIIETGLLVRSTDELRVKDIRSIELRRRGFLGWIGVGDLEFSSAARADANVVFRKIGRAQDVRDIVRQIEERQDNPPPGSGYPAVS